LARETSTFIPNKVDAFSDWIGRKSGCGRIKTSPDGKFVMGL